MGHAEAMNRQMRIRAAWAGTWIVLALAAVGRAEDFAWTTQNGTATLSKYSGPGGAVEIPAQANGLPVVAIGSGAFQDSFRLTSVKISDSVAGIGEQAFAYCSGLTNVAFGAGVSRIGDWAFRGCAKLAAIEVDARNASYGSDNGILFDRRRTVLILCPARKAGNVAIPTGVVEIASGAFARCSGLSGIAVPEGLVRIGDWAFDRAGVGAIIIPATVTDIGEGAFSGCDKLANIAMGANVVRIGPRAFEHTALTSIAMSNRVAEIGPWAFYACLRLKQIVLPESLSRIEPRTFFNCTALATATVPRKVESIGEWAFGECPALTAVYFKGIPPAVEPDVYGGTLNVTNFHLAGVAGWGSAFAGRPTAIGAPPIPTNAPPRVATNAPISPRALRR